MDPSTNIVLMDDKRVERSLKRMAHEIAEQNKENIPVLLFGINERGHAIAKKLAEILTPMFQEEIQTLQLPLNKENGSTSLEKFEFPAAQESFLVVVDDVIFTGQTMFTALKRITNFVDPSEIHTAVLVDRGHRKFPIKAEFYGISLPTKSYEHVRVIVKEEGRIEKVVLEKT